MNVLHIIANLDKVNFGIWNAALFGARALNEEHSIKSFVWCCATVQHEPQLGVPVRVLSALETAKTGFTELIRKEFDPNDTIVISHGSWLMPSRLGFFAAKAGFHWIYTPHGMLEPWSLANGYLKKKAYYLLVERKFIRMASAMRAVSKPEYENLVAKFKGPVHLIPNGVDPAIHEEKEVIPTVFLFMARLHHKKGILPLVQAWTAALGDNDNMQLIIAGPDDGELVKIRPYLKKNIRYIGAIYKEEKIAYLQRANYFVLPSFSEGFATSVLEAMSYGSIPIISKGCNFPEAFEAGLAVAGEPDCAQLAKTLRETSKRPPDNAKSARAIKFIAHNYSTGVLAPKMADYYNSFF